MVGAVGEAELGGRARGGLSLGGFLGEGLCVCVRVWRWRDPTDSETDRQLMRCSKVQWVCTCLKGEDIELSGISIRRMYFRIEGLSMRMTNQIW